MDQQTKQSDSGPKLPYRVFSDLLLELWAPRGPRRRLVLTTAGVAEISITDRFSEQILDLHWQEAAAYISTGDPARLAEFAGLVIDGRALAGSREAIAACFRMTED